MPWWLSAGVGVAGAIGTLWFWLQAEKQGRRADVATAARDAVQVKLDAATVQLAAAGAELERERALTGTDDGALDHLHRLVSDMAREALTRGCDLSEWLERRVLADARGDGRGAGDGAVPGGAGAAPIPPIMDELK